MDHYWVALYEEGAEKLSRGCVTAAEVGDAVDVCRLTFPRCRIKQISVLPYPAEPRWNHVEHEFADGQKESCPSFCYEPERCKGNTSCPKRPSCVE